MGRGLQLQNLYRSDRSREALVKVHDGDVVLVRDGYHPVVAGPGYDIYYLNFLAGTSRSMTVTEDPEHVWLRSTWKQTRSAPAVGSGLSRIRQNPVGTGPVPQVRSSVPGLKKTGQADESFHCYRYKIHPLALFTCTISTGPRARLYRLPQASALCQGTTLAGP